MASLSSFAIPIVLGSVFLWGIIRGIDVFGTFLEGASQGLKTVVSIIPALVCLLTAISMFKISGALDVLVHNFTPLAGILGVPPDLLPLALLRPLSGSGAMVLFRDILTSYGPDSFIGRAASVLEGSSETTFYTIAVYFGATTVKKTRHTVTASLVADFAAMVFSVLAVRLFFGG